MDVEEILRTVGIVLAVGLIAVPIASVLRLPSMVVLVAAGILAGPRVLDLVEVPIDAPGPSLLFSIGVALILFHGGMGISLRVIRETAVGLVLLTGILGLTSFGQAAFMGVGAYTTALLTTQAGWSPWLTLLAGFAVTGVIALILGLVTLRMQGHYLPLATIAWGMSLFYIFGNTPALGGFTGITDIPPITLFGTPLSR